MLEIAGPLKSALQRRAFLSAATFGVGGLATAALVGCGGDDDAAAVPAPAGAQPAAKAPAADDPRYVKDAGLPYAYNFPEPAGKTPKPGGTLTVGATWDVATMDPTKSAAGGTITVPNLVYNRLMGIKGGPEMVPFKIEVLPELARSWEKTPDGLTFLFKLTPGVKWQNVAPLNGRPLVAEDVAFAFKRYKSEGVHQSYYATVDTIDAPDPATVRITLKKATPEFEIPLASRYQTLFPRELVDSGEIDKKVVGTGPMILKDAIAGDKATFLANPNYWRRKVLLDGAEFRVMVDPSARVAAFRAKQIDYGYAVVDSKRDVDELLKTIPDLQINMSPVVHTGIPFGMNLQNPKFQDVRVRRAISLAIDRQEINTLIYEGIGKAFAPSMPWTFVFDKEPTDAGPWTRHDVAEAKKQLQAAGVENLVINYVYYAYGAYLDRQSEILVNQFAKSGITLKGGKVDYTQFNSQWVGGKLAEATTSGWGAVGFEANNYFYNQIHSKSPGNRWLLKDQQMDEWAEAQSVEINPEKRREIIRKIWDRELDQAFRPPLPAQIAFQIYQPWLRGIRFGGLLGASSSYYDWGAQVEGAWLDK